jgi:hypothetical protein
MHHKVKRLLPVFFGLIILSTVIVKVAEARRWVGDAHMAWTIEDEKFCHDGVVILSVDTSLDAYFPPDDNHWLDPYPHRLYARMYDTASTEEPDNSGHGDYPEAYGPRISTTQAFTLTYHTDANGEFVPLDDPDWNVYFYAEGELTWPRDLPVGTRVLVVSDYYELNTLVGEVQDCYLNRLTAPWGGTIVIDNQRLYADTSILDQSDAVFQLDTPPTHGELLLNGASLQAGDQFTQKDIDNGLLSYDHDFSDTTEDSFDYTLLSSTRRLSTGLGNTDSDGDSNGPTMSANGRFVAFASAAGNLVISDTNGFSDIYYHDLYTGQTELISVADNGFQGNSDSYDPAISRQGQLVFFSSKASNLVTGDSTKDCPYRSDSNNFTDIFGVFLGFIDDGNFNLGDTYRVSVENEYINDIETCVEGNGASTQAAISETWAGVFFTSDANNLAVSDTNATSDVFFEYYAIGVNPISVSQNGAIGNGPSSSPSIRSRPDPEGSSVVDIAFESHATNLLNGTSDTNNHSDIFVGERYSQEVVQVSVSSNGVQANGHSFDPSISSGGRFVAFISGATNLVTNSDTNGKSDIFLRDRDTDEDGVLDEVGAVSTTLISSAHSGGAGNAASGGPYISANGRFIVFTSWASNIVVGDSNGAGDVFVYDRQLGKVTRVSVGANGVQGDGGSSHASISDDGDYVIFESFASNLVDGDNNNKKDIFVHYRGFSATFPLAIDLPEYIYRIYLPLVVWN